MSPNSLLDVTGNNSIILSFDAHGSLKGLFFHQSQTIWSIMDDARHLIDIRNSSGKGLGIFAKSDIPCGTRVIAEPPLLKVDREKGDANDILKAFESLPISQRDLYLGLHGYASTPFKLAAEREMGQNWDALSEVHRQVLAIYAANAFGSVFLLGSRINHSCVPNLHFAYNTTIGKETFHAIRDIGTGEELTIMYINGTNRMWKQRFAELDNWGFQCNCPACEDTMQGRKKEERRRQLFTLDQELATLTLLGAQMPWKKALIIVRKLAAIQKAEGLLDRELGVSYHDAAKYCVKMGDAKMALLWAVKELEIDRICVGEDHPDYGKELEIVERLRASADSSKPIDKYVIDWFDLHDQSTEQCAIM